MIGVGSLAALSALWVVSEAFCLALSKLSPWVSTKVLIYLFSFSFHNRTLYSLLFSLCRVYPLGFFHEPFFVLSKTFETSHCLLRITFWDNEGKVRSGWKGKGFGDYNPVITRRTFRDAFYPCCFLHLALFVSVLPRHGVVGLLLFINVLLLIVFRLFLPSSVMGRSWEMGGEERRPASRALGFFCLLEQTA